MSAFSKIISKNLTLQEPTTVVGNEGFGSVVLGALGASIVLGIISNKIEDHKVKKIVEKLTPEMAKMEKSISKLFADYSKALLTRPSLATKIMSVDKDLITIGRLDKGSKPEEFLNYFTTQLVTNMRRKPQYIKQSQRGTVLIPAPTIFLHGTMDLYELELDSIDSRVEETIKKIRGQINKHQLPNTISLQFEGVSSGGDWEVVQLLDTGLTKKDIDDLYKSVILTKKKVDEEDDVKTGSESLQYNVVASPTPSDSAQSTTSTSASTPTSDQTSLVTFGEVPCNYPYCPVFKDIQDDGSIYYSAYICGGISSLNEYQNLMMVLMSASDKDTVHIYIDSPGGDLSTGAALSSVIENSKAHVIGEATGLCASAGSLVLGACKEMRATDFATIMYHMSSHLDWNNSARIKENAEFMVNYTKDKCLAVAQRRGIITEDELNDIVNKYKEVWIGSSEFRKRLSLSSENVESDHKSTDPSLADDVIKPVETVEENVVGEPENGDAEKDPQVNPTVVEDSSVQGVEAFQFNLTSIGEIPAIYSNSSGSVVGENERTVVALGIEEYHATPYNKDDIVYDAQMLNSMSREDTYKVILSQQLNASNIKSAGLGEDVQRGKSKSRKFSLIKVGDNDYHIYLDWMKDLYSPDFQTAFSRSLDKMTDKDTVTVILPGGVGDWCLPWLGGMISSMSRCKATLNTMLAGPCEFGDVVIWLYGQNRVVGNYGTLRMNADIMEWNDFVDYRGEYLKTVLNRTVELGYATEEDVRAFLEDNKTIILTTEK